MAITTSTIFLSTPMPTPSTKTFPNFSTRCRSTKTAISTVTGSRVADFLIRSLQPDPRFTEAEIWREPASSKSRPSPKKDRPSLPPLMVPLNSSQASEMPDDDDNDDNCVNDGVDDMVSRSDKQALRSGFTVKISVVFDLWWRIIWKELQGDTFIITLPVEEALRFSQRWHII